MLSSKYLYYFCLAVLVIGVNVKVSLCNEVFVDVDEHDSEIKKPGKTLYLTPYIEKGEISKAVHLATVKPFLKHVKSYAGYFTVNKHFNSNLFFWFFTADDENWEKLPVALWLQGGPGMTSLFAVFMENGPYKVHGKKIHRRDHSWNTKCNIIYIDSPVGTGFSFTEHQDGYAKNQTIIGEQLYSALKQFFTMFPRLLKNNFYLLGESYAGKYVPTLAYTIHKENEVSKHFHIKLAGLFIGNGLVDPVNMMHYGDYLYQLGLIDTNALRHFHSIESQIRYAIKEEEWHRATTLFSKLVLGFVYSSSGSLFKNLTGLPQHYNYVSAHAPDWNHELTELVTSNWFRHAIHVGNRPFGSTRHVAIPLTEDICKSVIDKVEFLLNHYRILLYTGQLDIICAYPLKINYLKKMKWSESKEYAKAERHLWRVNNELAGYYKTAGRLTEVLVRSAGHMVPLDQPLWAHTLFNRFVYNEHLNHGNDYKDEDVINVS